ncbi:MAG: hypothetical protein MJ218_02795 [Opitutales bacterium]|nr:hypothetical protein [Opitutales bacterium]
MAIGPILPNQLAQPLQANPIHVLPNRAVPNPVNSLEDIRKLYTHYVELFGNVTTKGSYEKIRDNILKQFNTVIQPVSGHTYGFPLKLQNILDDNPLPLPEETCLLGNKAYKDHIRDAVNQANSLYTLIDQAKVELDALKGLIDAEATDQEAIPCLNTLSILESQAKESTKAFSEYYVVNSGNVRTFAYELWFGEEKLPLLSNRAFTQYNTKELDLTQEFTSKITADDAKSLATLRAIQTQKYYYPDVVVIDTYYVERRNEEGEVEKILTDRFDPDAQVEINAYWNEFQTQTSPIALFNELTLLDRLKYIILYYTLNGERSVLPNNPKTGIPCIPTPLSTDYVKDTEEIGNVELFFIGYLVKHYNALYALALFMETKVNALLSVTKMVQRRIKALNFYLNLANRGFQALNQSQANGNASITNDAYCVLRYLGANITRTSIEMTINNSTDTYIVLQGVCNTPTADDHHTATNNYLLLKADNDTIQKFFQHVTGAGNNYPYYYDHLFDYSKGQACTLEKAPQWGYMTQDEYNRLIQQGYKKTDPCTVGIGCATQAVLGYPHVYPACFHCRHNNKGTIWNKGNLDSIYVLYEPEQNNLPKELETNRLNIADILVEKYAGSENTWNNYKNDNQGSWTALVKCWTTDYQTTIENINTEVTSTQKTVSNYRNKISNFESNAANCIKKLNLMYNQVVNKI